MRFQCAISSAVLMQAAGNTKKLELRCSLVQESWTYMTAPRSHTEGCGRIARQRSSLHSASATDHFQALARRQLHELVAICGRRAWRRSARSARRRSARPRTRRRPSARGGAWSARSASAGSARPPASASAPSRTHAASARRSEALTIAGSASRSTAASHGLTGSGAQHEASIILTSAHLGMRELWEGAAHGCSKG